MNREEWISYYESINGHRPSISEVYEAEKNGDLLFCTYHRFCFSLITLIFIMKCFGHFFFYP